MAITDKNTCLVLGAGVSAPFGLALGGDLIDSIQKQLDEELSELHGSRSSQSSLAGRIISSATKPANFSKMPIIATVMRSYINETREIENSNKANDEIKMMEELVHLLSGQTSETIDDFIVENSSFSDVVKKAIAVNFFQNSYSFSQGEGYVLNNFSSRYTKSGERN